MGLQMPNFDGSGMPNDDDDDDDLEAELQRLQQGMGSNKGSKARKPGLLYFFNRIIKDILYKYSWNSTRSSSIS